MNRRNQKVIKYRRPIRLNIGVIVFLFILIYIIIITFSFFNKKRISFYEVTEKNIADDNTCQGIIIRDETVVNSTNAGYINYYIKDASRVAKNATIYTLDESGDISGLLSGTESENTYSEADISTIREDIASYKKSYTDSNYDKMKSFKYDIDNTILETSNISMASNLNKILEDYNVSASFHIVKSPESGIVTYTIDGLEGITAEEVTGETFHMENYQRKQLRSVAEATEANTPVYKMITDENWSIVLLLTKEQYDKLHLKETEQLANDYTTGRVTVNFIKNSLKTTVDFTTYQKGEDYFARLDLDKYLIRFIDDRFLEVELLLNSAEGLKIPLSSITEKSFYLVPLTYITTGGDSNKTGIIKEVYSEKGEVEFVFTASEIYYDDGEYAYLDENAVEAGNSIRNPETQETYKISRTESLKGVYNVNKGYCVFRRIEKIYENEEYCIVKKESSYGLSAYDHIVVDAATVSNQEIIR